MATEKKVKVIQVRSGNRCDKRTIATLKALGLGRIGKVKEHKLTSATRGMIDAVSHLVEARDER
jgi:large subunit ribosomal protein L30